MLRRKIDNLAREPHRLDTAQSKAAQPRKFEYPP